MAITLNRPTPFGLDATYWNIMAVSSDYAGARMVVSLAGYVSKGARDDGAKPIASEQVTMGEENFIPDASRTAIYEAIKVLPDWQGADA